MTVSNRTNVFMEKSLTEHTIQPFIRGRGVRGGGGPVREENEGKETCNKGSGSHFLYFFFALGSHYLLEFLWNKWLKT